MKKNLIYQYWDGIARESMWAGVQAMEEYAKRIDAEYIFELNPKWLKTRFNYDFGYYTPHYGAFKPVYEEAFQDFENIMFADTDVFPVEGLEENIFDSFTGDIGICTEPMQPAIREISRGMITSDKDIKWRNMIMEKLHIKLPVDTKGRLRVYNSGMVLYSPKARQVAREKWLDFREYVQMCQQNGVPGFYVCDQPYLHAMMYYSGLAVQEMDNGWNSYVHFTKIQGFEDRLLCDWRDESTKFVHVQFAGADNLSEEEHYRIVNLPVSEWDLTVKLPESFHENVSI